MYVTNDAFREGSVCQMVATSPQVGRPAPSPALERRRQRPNLAHPARFSATPAGHLPRHFEARSGKVPTRNMVTCQTNRDTLSLILHVAGIGDTPTPEQVVDAWCAHSLCSRLLPI
jgi:hypothetical protein